MKQTWKIRWVASLLLVGLCSCRVDEQPAKESQPAVGPVAEQAESTPPVAASKPQKRGILSQFSAQDLDGKTVDQAVLQGAKLTMVNVWATYCSPCLAEMPALGELALEYAQQGVQIIGLVSDAVDAQGEPDAKTIALAKEAVKKQKATYLHLVPSNDMETLLLDIQAVPTSFFVDAEGHLVGKIYLGSKSKATWKRVINQTLKDLAE